LLEYSQHRSRPFDLSKQPEQPKGNTVDDFFTEADVVSVYTREQAIEDGILVRVPYRRDDRQLDLCFTANLFTDYKEDETARDALIERGIRLLQQFDPEDLPGVRKLRVIDADRIWVVEDFIGGPLTFMRPEDY